MKSFDLSDCGSHLLEHLYGIIRRFSAGDDSQEKFDQSLEKSICLRKWSNELHIPGYIPGRLHQDSAAKVEAEVNSPNFPSFGSYVIWALQIFIKLFGSECKCEKLININKFSHIYPHVKFTLDIPTEAPQPRNSLRQNFSINNNGNRNDIRFSTMQQKDQYMKTLDPQIEINPPNPQNPDNFIVDTSNLLKLSMSDKEILESDSSDSENYDDEPNSIPSAETSEVINYENPLIYKIPNEGPESTNDQNLQDLDNDEMETLTTQAGQRPSQYHIWAWSASV